MLEFSVLFAGKTSKCGYSQLYGEDKQVGSVLMMKTEIVFETSVSTKAEPHYPAENPKDLLQEK
jgi:hypothetical protein